MIAQKRNDLELFIKEQMLGPGACGLRYFSSKVDKEKLPPQSISYLEEVINTTPGSLYSTGILFPKKDIYEDHLDEDQDRTAPVEQNYDDDNKKSNSDRSDDGSLALDVDDDDMFSLSQRFPNTIGISCCLSPDYNNSLKDRLKVVVSGRYYRVIDKDDREKIHIRIEDNDDKFKIFYSSLETEIKEFLNYEDGFLSPKYNLNSKTFNDFSTLVKRINLQKAKEIAYLDIGVLDPIYSEIKKEEHRYLKSYKEKLFNHLRKVNIGGEYISDEAKNVIIGRIEQVEIYETFLSYLEDVLSIYNSKSYGFWKSEYFEKEIDLNGCILEIPNGKSKATFKPIKESTLKDIVEFRIDDKTKASLSVWLQLTRDTRNVDNNSMYLKVLLENTSTKYKEDSKHYFSIVTEGVNKLSFFGVEIKIISEYLQPYKIVNEELDPYDENSKNRYLFRNIKDFAVGHTCSADWGKTEYGIPFVKSVFIPGCEIPDIEAIPRNKNKWEKNNVDKFSPVPYLADNQCLQFKWLSLFSDANNSDIRQKLIGFVNIYKKWICDLDDENSSIAKSNIADCLKDYERMKSNIELLLGNDQNMDSFRIMNSAMFMQLWHGNYAGKELYRLKTSDPNCQLDYQFYKSLEDKIGKVDQSATWRPFQLAFILLNLDGIIQRSDDSNWEKRNEIVDLVWFPTGGGKTEAYLGIIALSIIQRRRTRKAKESGGTTAIMRYTLRLLATQQFQRAMRVIFALEAIRRWETYHLGAEIISIGLFVGDDSVPNTEEGLNEECGKWGKNEDSKVPLTNCPWCGEPLTYSKNAQIINGQLAQGNEVVFRCSNIRCTFGDFIPVMLCDEYIFRYPPTLLFGTVDKFAALAHKVSSKKNELHKDARRLFGKGVGINFLTPDLIIQDELHLLLGPLGTAVALFEAAIDQLCTRYESINGTDLKIRPKIISSTATTRNTPFQIRALYDRNVNTFPKNGVDYDDSFFAFYQRIIPGEKLLKENIQFLSKRKYIGILPTGRTQMTTQLRLVATLFVHRALFEKKNINNLYDPSYIRAANYYYSVISYFNSLKEVGKTDAQFYTEFVKYTRRLFKRVLRPSNMLECLYSYETSFSKCELTGRLSGSEVVKELSKVETNWSPLTRLPNKIDEEGHYQGGITPPDFIVATNMISVGLDVSRFNTIIMNSMPRNIAEYIQASSRVARDEPGLVITLHNPFRARDLSHFEKFREFHEKMYCYVEPISITPFSEKAIDRFLPLYLATIIRHSVDNLSDRSSAGNLDAKLSKELIDKLAGYFDDRERRSEVLSGIEKNLLTENSLCYIKQYIERSLKEWLSKIESLSKTESLVYSGADFVNGSHKKKTIREKNLFVALDAYDSDDNTKNWKVPQSLRTIDPEAVIRIEE